MAKISINRSNFLKRSWMPHLFFWIVLIAFVATNFLITSANAVDSTMSFDSYKSTRISADLGISFSQPSLLMTRGVSEYQMNGWIRRSDIAQQSWDHLSLFLVDKNGGLFWIADQSESNSFGVITPTDLNDPDIDVKIRLPTTLIPPGVYYMGVELRSKEKNCYYSVNEGKFFFVTPNSMQFVKPKNLAKIQSIGTRQRALNFLKATFFPEKK
jgi:hypothetical protein